ncbi:uncharacterized protein LOC129654084 isoform X2 [Bubalus kerabau]|uniref:uncharacterized protein LOC129654084 isoform X2 n=1 Tax=Bubalus carabanensis TaxID=3119969 RepID=UPI00244E98EB|nr:uncharacterized protein LOC129654084 isoform X2 [Bubalus carabanensis]
MSRKYFAAPKRNTCLTASFNLSPNRCQYTRNKNKSFLTAVSSPLLREGQSGRSSRPSRPLSAVQPPASHSSSRETDQHSRASPSGPALQSLQTSRLDVDWKAWMNRNVTSLLVADCPPFLLAESQRWPEVYTSSLQPHSQPPCGWGTSGLSISASQGDMRACVRYVDVCGVCIYYGLESLCACMGVYILGGEVLHICKTQYLL